MLCMQKWQIMNLFIGCRVFYGVDSTQNTCIQNIHILNYAFLSFLVATKRLYKRVGVSVRPSVRPSVRGLVTLSLFGLLGAT